MFCGLVMMCTELGDRMSTCSGPDDACEAIQIENKRSDKSCVNPVKKFFLALYPCTHGGGDVPDDVADCDAVLIVLITIVPAALREREPESECARERVLPRGLTAPHPSRRFGCLSPKLRRETKK